MDEPIWESGPHLAGLLRSELQGDGPLYRQLSAALKRAIDRGEIPLGTMLPPERSLAKALSVSRATVVAAYDRLKGDGWLESRQGSGTWVRVPDRAATPPGVDAVSTGRLFLSDDGQEQRTGPDETGFGRSDIVDLSVAAVASSATVTQILASLPGDEMTRLTTHHGYVPQGLRSLRQIVANRFSLVGLPTAEDHLLITTGAHQAISLIARQTLQPGDPVLVESPTFPGALDIFRRFGARLIPLPVDEYGVRPEMVADLLAKARPSLMYLSPHFHNPTGSVMPDGRRREIGRLAAEANVVLLEDLALADVPIDPIDLPPPIAALAPEATVHTIGSTSKLFWAGLRIGWIRSPEDWSVRMLATKTVADLGSPVISQLVAMKCMTHFDRVQDERRAELRQQRDLMCALLEEHLPEFEFRRPPGGLSVWAHLPQGNADEFADVAMRHGVAIVPGPSLSVDEGNRRAVRLVYSRPDYVIREGVARLAQSWTTYAPTTSRTAARLLV